MKKTKPFFITRKRLAERLAMEGIEVLPCQNIYEPEQQAWKCRLTRTAAEIIKEEYAEIGKELPDCVLDALKQ